jgi:hypothetical protein
MADKKTYTVNRAMLGDKDYARGDTRELTAAEAAPLLETGAISEKGKEPEEREPAVRHTFGTLKNEDEGYVPATTDSVQLRDTRTKAAGDKPKPGAGK